MKSYWVVHVSLLPNKLTRFTRSSAQRNGAHAQTLRPVGGGIGTEMQSVPFGCVCMFSVLRHIPRIGRNVTTPRFQTMRAWNKKYSSQVRAQNTHPVCQSPLETHSHAREKTAWRTGMTSER